MGNALEHQPVQRVLARLYAAGVASPPDPGRNTQTILCGGNTGARLRAEANPDDEWPTCCIGGGINGPEGCTCWTPVYDLEQAEPQPPQGPEDIPARAGMCHDCAYRPGSPERTDPLMTDELMKLPTTGTPFWCHDGMRRPTYWQHPDGRTITGPPDDWHPPFRGQIPYRADGTPALLCAGWTAIAARKEATNAEG